MNADKRSTMSNSVENAPKRKILGLPRSADDTAQTKASLSTWEGEGGAVASAAPVSGSKGAPDTDATIDAETLDAIDTIAAIEMHRQLMEKEEGGETARMHALRRLHDALVEEKQSAERDGGNAAHAQNVDALASAIEKTSLRGPRDASSAQPDMLRKPASRQNTRRSPDRPRVRGTIGRYGRSR